MADTLVIVSPHLDDAALSCGQLIVDYPGVVVVTVFAGMPADPLMLTTYDRDCRFTSARQAMAARHVEDTEAMKSLHAQGVRLGFVDHQYQPGEAADVDAIAEAVAKVLADEGTGRLAFPLGLDHPDHLAVHDSCLRLAPDVEAYVYEELPNRVLQPEQAVERLHGLRDAGWDVSAGFLGCGTLRRKQQAVACYRSQLWALHKQCLWVPERIWRVKR